MQKNMYKFNIEKKLNELEFSDRHSALKELIEITGVSQLQFYRWRRIQLSDSADIPTSKLALVAKYFGCSIEELIHPDALKNILPTQSRSKSNLENRYGMTC